jgi:hypothetical protein
MFDISEHSGNEAGRVDLELSNRLRPRNAFAPGIPSQSPTGDRFRSRSCSAAAWLRRPRATPLGGMHNAGDASVRAQSFTV